MFNLFKDFREKNNINIDKTFIAHWGDALSDPGARTVDFAGLQQVWRDGQTQADDSRQNDLWVKQWMPLINNQMMTMPKTQKTNCNLIF